MKQGNKDKVGEVTEEEDSRSDNRHSQREKVKEKVRPNEDNKSSLLAGSVWKTTGIHDHNMLVYPETSQRIERFILKVQSRRLTAMKLSSWLPRMIHLIESKTP
jgi:hypothetical protein